MNFMLGKLYLVPCSYLQGTWVGLVVDHHQEVLSFLPLNNRSPLLRYHPGNFNHPNIFLLPEEWV